MILGTHNSATGGKLLWWLKPFAWVINLTSKCQDKTIQEQLKDGVSWFNLQVTFYKNKWLFSHGLALYKEDVLNTLEYISKFACIYRPIYIQLFLDRSFWGKKDIEQFYILIHKLEGIERSNPYMYIQHIEIEPNSTVIKDKVIHGEEHYWTLSWAKENKGWLNKLPLPRYHAKKYNKQYIKNCSHTYLMLDFYNIQYTVQKA